MLYSGYEKAGNRWLVYASEQEMPQIRVSKAWKQESFVAFDDFQVQLPEGAVIVESSPTARGTTVHSSQILRPLSANERFRLLMSGLYAFTATMFLGRLLWSFFKPKSTDGATRPEEGL